MKQQISWKQFLEMNPRQSGFDADYYSRIIVKSFLQWGFGTLDVDVEFTEGNNCSDLSWTSPKSGKKFLGEIKDRSGYDSKAFNDHIVEEIKVQSLARKIYNGVAEQASIFSIYNDGVLKLTRNIQGPGSFLGKQESPCPRTTTLGDNTIIQKTLYKFKPDNQFYFRFLYDDETNRYTIEFSEKPFVLDGPQFVDSITLL